MASLLVTLVEGGHTPEINTGRQAKMQEAIRPLILMAKGGKEGGIEAEVEVRGVVVVECLASSPMYPCASTKD